MMTFPSAFGLELSALEKWLPDMDLNHDFGCSLGFRSGAFQCFSLPVD